VREWLEKIADEDLERLNFKGGRPEWMIITILPVPPMTMRPSIVLETGERSEDDLTHKLVDIVRINERLKRILEIGAPDFLISDIIELLQYHVATYIKNDLANVPPARHRSGRPLKTLAQRLTGKEGRFRFNLTGKRVNFSARSVISPDNFINLNEVGVPKIIAKTLTIPERVTENNIEEMKKLVLNADKYPGANYVIRTDGLKKKITKETKQMIAEEIIPGYVVERHLQDGDWVIFNRQPSLHRMSIRSPRYGLPIIGAKHDHLMATYFLTKDGIKLSKNEVANLLMSTNIDVELDKDIYSGKEVFSFLLPKINFEGKTKTGEKVIIKDGKLVEGYIDENAIGAEKGELLNKIELLCGSDEAAKFIENVVKLGLNFMTTHA